MKAVRRRLMAAASVMTVGAVSALPFYHDSSTPDSAKNSSATGPTSTPNISAVALQIPGGESANTACSDAESKSRPEVGATPTAESMESRAGAGETRPLPTPQLTHRRPAAEENVPPAVSIRRSGSQPVSSVGREPQPEYSRPRTHWITDGDTLEELARRFLGDRSRWPEIRAANPDILTTDDVLPIGKEIRIPPREGRSSQAPSPTTVEPNGLVPISWNQE